MMDIHKLFIVTNSLGARILETTFEDESEAVVAAKQILEAGRPVTDEPGGPVCIMEMTQAFVIESKIIPVRVTLAPCEAPREDKG